MKEGRGPILCKATPRIKINCYFLRGVFYITSRVCKVDEIMLKDKKRTLMMSYAAFNNIDKDKTYNLLIKKKT